MSAAITTPAAGIPFLDGYAPAEGNFDEMFSGVGTVRPHCQKVLDAMHQIGRKELSRRWDQAQRLIRENGLMYNAYGDPADANRPWNLDAMPLMIEAKEWQAISQGLVQRATLLNRILQDLYGPQQLLRSGSLPAGVVFAHPGFLRPFHGQKVQRDCFLHFYSADLARSPDGRWWVVADRTDAPMGAGYALENRIVISRMLPAVIRDCQVERLARFFIAMQETLRRLAPAHRENPRIVLLTQGPTIPNYFEDVYLARYLGYTLAEPGDLTVREQRVMLKTLGGLLPVDVILRRLSDVKSDPLELRGKSSLGVSGLLQVSRMGNVAIANALGSSLVESPAFMGFLPRLCDELLGQKLQLPSLATWWCGEPAAMNYVLDNLDRLAVKSAYRVDRQEPHATEHLAGRPRDFLASAIKDNPTDFVAQEHVERSTVPVLTADGVEPARVALRVYLVASNGSYLAMPGGLVRVSSTSAPLDWSILAGDSSKDAWVMSEGPVQVVSLLKPAEQAVELRRGGDELPSRVADNLYWLGRHIERADGSARLLRTTLTRLTSEADPDSMPELAALVRALAAQGQVEPGFAVEGIRQLLPEIEDALPASVLDAEQPSSLLSMLRTTHRLAGQVRDRISLDAWRILHRVHQDVQPLARRRTVEASDLLAVLNQLIIDLASFGGVVTENMTRTQGWRLMSLGRHIERGLHIINLVQSALVELPRSEAAVLNAALEVADSLMTYRSRYRTNLQLAPVLDLLLTDETNPRSLAYQLAAIAEHIDNLPRDGKQTLRAPEQRTAMNALNRVRMVDVETLCEAGKPRERMTIDRLLDRLAEQLPKLSEMISHKYLIHAAAPRQLIGKS